MGLCDFDQIFELESLSKTVFIVNPAKKLQNPFLLNNIGDDTLPQAIHGGTGHVQKLVELMRVIHFFVAVSFAHS